MPVRGVSAEKSLAARKANGSQELTCRGVFDGSNFTSSVPFHRQEVEHRKVQQAAYLTLMSNCFIGYDQGKNFDDPYSSASKKRIWSVEVKEFESGSTQHTVRASLQSQPGHHGYVNKKVLFVYSLISCVSVLVKGPEKEHF
jgi:hypothetical protein